MKRIYTLVALFLVLVFAACRGRDNKDSQPEKAGGEINTDSLSAPDNTRRPPEEKMPGKTAPSTTRGLHKKPDRNEILTNIDQYLVSKASFATPPAGGGISNAGVSIQNILEDITFQKAIVEVSILMADGAEFRTDYYVLQNIEPGDIKTVRIPNAARGTSIVCHIVKLKSNELTNGEMLLVGSHFVAK